MNKLQYYSHILLQSKYAFIFKLIIIFFIYLTFNYNNLICCTNDFEIEKIRVEERLIAYTNMEPDQLLQRLEEWKQQQQRIRLPRSLEPRFTYEQLSTPLYEKKFLGSLQQESLTGTGRGYPIFDSKEDVKEVYCLLRMYRRLNQMSMTSLAQEKGRTQIVQEESKSSSVFDYFSSCNIS